MKAILKICLILAILFCMTGSYAAIKSQAFCMPLQNTTWVGTLKNLDNGAPIGNMKVLITNVSLSDNIYNIQGDMNVQGHANGLTMSDSDCDEDSAILYLNANTSSGYIVISGGGLSAFNYLSMAGVIVSPQGNTNVGIELFKSGK